MRLPAPTIALILTILASPSSAQRRRLSDQQAALMVDGTVSQTDIPNIGEEAMVQSIAPLNATKTPIPLAQPTPQAMPAKPILPITVLLYSSSPGPKECRGTPIFNLNIPKGPGLDTPPGPTCYNVTVVPQAECGTFMANMEDGCQARIFGEPGCASFTNLAVFMDELRPVGGIIRSIEVQCGIKSAQPAPLALNLPAKQKPAGSPANG
ncbi:hypothetical protein BKA67DRAFT_539590 [Truncatella angustata]|uniref:Uncharacterized protein n=1 Tax=Truncatella angustata TaxID=152316 RepID=A0A9P8RP27_9PEZI|nr:uncharacterized protein BKA67DRAFT_539590 [Truncatella angustata]KAH6647745.1 hypothetical protein BKA67DRAFT_539590 [Truncatella angustata]KAH8204464.1 hypothetical protein TruAng_001380 [Truncatella angustata]